MPGPFRAADLRATIAAHRFKLYIIGAAARIHPASLSLIVNGHVAPTPNQLERIQAAIAELKARSAQ